MKHNIQNKFQFANFFSPKYPNRICNPSSFVSNKYLQGVLSTGTKQQGEGFAAKHSPPSIAHINNEFKYTEPRFDQSTSRARNNSPANFTAM
jgi:hypothetical protein